MNTLVLRLENASKTFGATQALRNVSLSVYPGEVHCIIGENGAGKSTLGKVCGGLVQPDSGKFWLDGQEAPFFSLAGARAAGVAMVFQELSLAPDLSVQDNLCLGEQPTRNPLRTILRSRERQHVTGILHAVGLDAVDPRQPVGELPPGRQQLVEIAKGLARKPRILLLDEPTAMLSLEERKHLHAIMRELCAAGTAIVFVTHHVAEVAEMAHRVTVLRNGSLVQTLEGRQTEQQIVSYLGGSAAAVRKEVVHHAHAGDVDAVKPLLSFDVGRREGGVERIRIRPGDIVGLYGVVGCGRERVAAAVCGQISSASDLNIELDGKRVGFATPVKARRLGIGHLPNGRAANGILPTRSIRENLYLRPAAARGWASMVPLGRDADRELRDLGARYGRADDLITSLSGGNQQKVLLGRLLGAGLRLLVLEEPTAGIDIAAKADIHALLRKYTAKGLAILLISSDLEETIQLSDRLHTIFDGKCVRTYVAPTVADIPPISADVVGAAVAGTESFT